MGDQMIEDSPNIVIIVQILMNHSTSQNDKFRHTVDLKNLDLARCVQIIRSSPYIVVVMFVQILMRGHRFYLALHSNWYVLCSITHMILSSPYFTCIELQDPSFHVVKKDAFLCIKRQKSFSAVTEE